MKDKIHRLSKDIQKQIINSSEYQEYLILEKAINNSSIKEKEENLKLLQQQMTISLDENKMEYHLQLVAKYEKEKESFFNDPLYNNYIVAKRALNDLLQSIAAIIKF